MSPKTGYKQSPDHIKKQADAHRKTSIIDGTFVCRGCGVKKPMSEFYRSRSVCTGFTYLCKVCENEKVRMWNMLQKKERPRRTWARKTISAHRSLGYSVFIDSDELTKLAEETDDCFLCGEKLIWGGSAHSKRSPSLDRLYNESVLKKDNVEIVCYECNRTKGDLPLNKFLAYCQLISSKFIGGCPINNERKDNHVPHV